MCRGDEGDARALGGQETAAGQKGSRIREWAVRRLLIPAPGWPRKRKLPLIGPASDAISLLAPSNFFRRSDCAFTMTRQTPLFANGVIAQACREIHKSWRKVCYKLSDAIAMERLMQIDEETVIRGSARASLAPPVSSL